MRFLWGFGLLNEDRQSLNGTENTIGVARQDKSSYVRYSLNSEYFILHRS